MVIRVRFHGCGKIQLISMARYLLQDLESSQTFKIQLRGGPGSLDMSAEEPNLISFIINWGREAVFVCLFGLQGLGICHLRFQVRV